MWPGQAQYSHMLLRQAITSRPLRELQIWMLENLRENLTCRKAGQSDRIEREAVYSGLSSGNEDESRSVRGPHARRSRPTVDRQLIHGPQGDRDACGFQSADSMRRTFLRVLGVSAAEVCYPVQSPPRIKRRSFQADHRKGIIERSGCLTISRPASSIAMHTI